MLSPLGVLCFPCEGKSVALLGGVGGGGAVEQFSAPRVCNVCSLEKSCYGLSFCGSTRQFLPSLFLLLHWEPQTCFNQWGVHHAFTATTFSADGRVFAVVSLSRLSVFVCLDLFRKVLPFLSLPSGCACPSSPLPPSYGLVFLRSIFPVHSDVPACLVKKY